MELSPACCKRPKLQRCRHMGIQYRASNIIGKWNRKRFVGRLQNLEPVAVTDAVDFDVYSFSGERDLPEQVASIRTFLKFVGRPRSFYVVSDESHSPASLDLLHRIDRSVSVVPCSHFIRPDTPLAIKDYAAIHPLGKKLAIVYSIGPERPTLYVDSDILFFPSASSLRHLPFTDKPLFLLDCWPSLDDRMLQSKEEKTVPVNSGFFCWSKPLAWDGVVDRLAAVGNDPSFFTEQTCIHLAIKRSGGQPLPHDAFILRNEDQFLLRDTFASDSIALRHYISSIRTKMWHNYARFQ